MSTTPELKLRAWFSSSGRSLNNKYMAWGDIALKARVSDEEARSHLASIIHPPWKVETTEDGVLFTMEYVGPMVAGAPSRGFGGGGVGHGT